MNPQPISQAHDADLRLSQIALQRAARRARELAVQTGTDIIVSCNGVIERIAPASTVAAPGVQEPTAPYGKAP